MTFNGMDTAPPSSPLQVSLLALPETTLATLHGLHEVFSAVGGMWHEATGEHAPARPIQARIVARRGSPFPSPSGLPVTPHSSLADAVRPDVIIVTDLALTRESRTRGRWSQETAWVREQHANGALVCSVCTGSVFLAEAGLLDGLEASSHWSVASLFTAHYPAVKLHCERILCPSGPEHRLITCGGSGAWSELALYLIARFSGPAEAVRIAKIFLFGDLSEGQLPFAALGKAARHEDAVIGRCQRWLADHYAEANPVARMAALSGLPERTFKRRFRIATGYTSMDYVQALRVEEAKQMLEASQEGIDAIAEAVGYDDPAFFRRLFKRLTGTTPARYRQRYNHTTMAPVHRAAGG